MKNKQQSKTTDQSGDCSSYLNTNKNLGLTAEEVNYRRQLFGTNVLVKAKRQNIIISFFKILLFELMSLLLFISGVVGLVLAIIENIHGEPYFVLSYAQSGVLLSIVILNALFGTIQEAKSNNAIDELEKMSSPFSKVLRNGKIQSIPSSEIVIGDVIIVEAGDSIAADAILFMDSHLKVSEAILTGESSEIMKDSDVIVDPNAPIGDQKNKIFAGTNVLNGKGYGIVCAISNQTEIGKVADLLNDREAVKTPLQLKLQKLGKILGIFGIIITMITFIFSLFVIENIINIENTEILNAVQSSLLLAISLAAAAIPEGLAAIVTIVLSIGVKEMSKRQALIKKLPSVETLGSTAVICSDKTGTLTMNKMTLTKLWSIHDSNNDFDLNSISLEKKELLIKTSLCTDATIDENINFNARKNPVGDPTEIAILEFALSKEISIINLKHQYKRIREIPFDSNRKLMSTVNVIDGKKYLIVKGAPDVVFDKCKNSNLSIARNLNNEWSKDAIRVLAVAQKELKDELPEDLNPQDYEYDLEFLGLVGMIDPPREEVKKSIKDCISAGIKPVMITGDYLNTAVSIAKSLGIIKDEKKQLAISGAELDLMSDEELSKNIEKYSVYARVSPENKIRIVKAWQTKDQVVAMTGDGVNDAPALRAADIGCAMGVVGTDVAKQAADMILMDDNFSTIVESVKLGRNIYENIRRIVKFLLSSNITSVFSIVLGMIVFYIVFQIIGWGNVTTQDINSIIGNSLFKNLPPEEIANQLNRYVKFQTTITTIQILINNIIIETLPGIALGTQITTTNLMNQRPRSKYESIFANKLILQILRTGIMHGTLTITAFALGTFVAIENNEPLLRFYYGTMAAFLTLTFGGVLKSLSMSSPNLIWKVNVKENKWIYITSFISLSMIIFIISIPQLSSMVGERPDLYNLEYKDIILTLSGNRTKDDFMHWLIYLIGFGFGFITFIGLEVVKFYDISKNNISKKIEKNIEFKLIERPKKFSWK